VSKEENSAGVEKLPTAMEDIQFSTLLAEASMPAMDGISGDFLPAEAMDAVLEAPCKAEIDAAAELKAPKNTVEVVITQKPVAKTEEPILPDHYYDDGNVPVFKPVRLSFEDH
jgi:hypothetical protein